MVRMVLIWHCFSDGRIPVVIIGLQTEKTPVSVSRTPCFPGAPSRTPPAVGTAAARRTGSVIKGYPLSPGALLCRFDKEMGLIMFFPPLLSLVKGKIKAAEARCAFQRERSDSLLHFRFSIMKDVITLLS